MIVSLPPSQPPQLMVVIDTEEEFDWTQPLRRNAADVTALREIGRAQEIFDRFGIVPVYAVDYPVASQADQAPDLKAAIAESRALVGAHLHSWVTPPFEEELSEYFSFQGNLPKDLEREKLVRLKECIEESFGLTPLMHKAGRYGVGANTMEILKELGFLVDLSFSPGFNSSRVGGPDYRRMSNHAQWLDAEKTLLELPTTGGFNGILTGLGPALYPLLESPPAETMKIKALASRLGLLERMRLSPEGYTLEEMKRMTGRLLKLGVRVLTFSFHSPSVAPGFTPYVRTDEDRGAFLALFDDYFRFFRDELEGEFTTPLRVRERLLANEPA